MDLGMPHVDGYQAARRIRTAERAGALGRTAIIALTASALEENRVHVLDSGCDEIVTKPFQQATLFAAIERLLGARFDHAPTTPGRELQSGGDLVSRMRELPGPLRGELEHALVAGDDLGAQRICERIAADHPSLAGELRSIIGAFKLDELLHVLEQAST
jgi:hypothetical protein